MSTYGQQFAQFVRSKLAELGWTTLGKVNAERLAEWADQFQTAQTAQGEMFAADGVNVKPTETADAPEKRDLLFEAVCGVCGMNWRELTPAARKPLNSAVSQLRAVGATPEEVRRRAVRFQGRYPTVTLRPVALCRHWPELATPEADVVPIHAPAYVGAAEPVGWREWLAVAYPDESWAHSAAALGWSAITPGMRGKIAREFQPKSMKVKNL